MCARVRARSRAVDFYTRVVIARQCCSEEWFERVFEILLCVIAGI